MSLVVQVEVDSLDASAELGVSRLEACCRPVTRDSKDDLPLATLEPGGMHRVRQAKRLSRRLTLQLDHYVLVVFCSHFRQRPSGIKLGNATADAVADLVSASL